MRVCGIPKSFEGIGHAGQGHDLRLEAQQKDETLGLLDTPRYTSGNLGVCKYFLDLYQLSLGEDKLKSAVSPPPDYPAGCALWVDESRKEDVRIEDHSHVGGLPVRRALTHRGKSLVDFGGDNFGRLPLICRPQLPR